MRLDDHHGPDADADELAADLQALVDQRVGRQPLGGDAPLPRRLSEQEAVSIAGAFLEWPHGQEAEVAAHIAETIISFAFDYARPGVGRLRENRELPVRGTCGWLAERNGLDCESRPSAWGYSPQGGDSYCTDP